MSNRHSIATIVSVAVVSIGLAAILHEGLGHGVMAWLRGDVVTELTSNHLSTLQNDRLVEAGGTFVNILTGVICLAACFRAGNRSNLRYFLWLFGAINLLQGTGYFLFSGVIGVGDWAMVIQGLPHQAVLRTLMTIVGAISYFLSVRLIGVAVRPFIASPAEYSTVAKLAYLAACAFYCLAGALDPLGIKLLFVSTIPAAFGGTSGLLWADRLMPRAVPARPLAVQPGRAWWAAGVLFGAAFIVVFGRGISFKH